MGKLGEGVHDIYKERAAKGGDVLWHVTVKGQKELTPGIPLHMSLKVFEDNKDMDLEEIKRKIKEFDVKIPDPAQLTFKTTIFTSERDGKKYYMLKIHGCDKSYKDFYESMKHCGTVYKEYMAHITIDKGLYDKIEKEGIKPEEVKFHPLCIEAGAGNTIYEFEKSENLEKSVFRNMATGAAMTAALALSPQHAQAPQQNNPQYSSQRMLNAIAQVESSGGKNVNHAAGGGAIHGNEHAMGKFGLMPQTIRETVHLNRDLASKHSKLMRLKGSDLNHYMQDNPGLEDQIASKHLGRLEHHFGQDPVKLGYAWLNGVSGTNKALKEKKDIGSHWHAQKVKDAYVKGK